MTGKEFEAKKKKKKNFVVGRNSVFVVVISSEMQCNVFFFNVFQIVHAKINFFF